MYHYEVMDISPEHLALDHENPRFFIDKTLSQPEIIVQLLDAEDVQGLARSIAHNGLMPGERLIIVREGGSMIAVEGNRRLCAIKLLLDASLIPPAYRNTFPRPSAEVASSLSTIAVDVLADRVAAEPIITRRHTSPDVKSWGVLQKIRRTQRYWQKHKSLDLVAGILGEGRGDVARDLREYALYDLALTLPRWKKAERARLNDVQLAANPYIRFASRQEVREVLGLVFDADYSLELSRDKEKTRLAVEHMVRQFLLPGVDGSPPPKNTRADDSSEIKALQEFFLETSEGNTSDTQNSGPQGADPFNDADKESEEKAPKDSPAPPDPFFRFLNVRINDPAVTLIAKEIKKVLPTSKPMTACLLLRCLVEAVFVYQLNQKNLTPEPVKQGRGPAITGLVNQMIANYKEFQLTKSDVDILDSCRAQKHFDYLNWGAHSAVMPNGNEVKMIADRLRVVIQKLV